jgi:hypothetical protein
LPALGCLEKLPIIGNRHFQRNGDDEFFHGEVLVE